MFKTAPKTAQHAPSIVEIVKAALQTKFLFTTNALISQITLSVRSSNSLITRLKLAKTVQMFVINALMELNAKGVELIF